MKLLTLIWICCLLAFSTIIFSQGDSTYTDKIYNINKAVEIPITVIGWAGVFYGYGKLPEYTSLTEQQISQLNSMDVNAFDRPAIYFPVYEAQGNHDMSDRWLSVSVLTPALLLFNKKIKKNWADVLTLYVETQLIGSMIYIATVHSIKRPRPLAYNNELSLNFRAGHNINNSFYSGHTSTAAIGSFFWAKVFCDHTKLTKLQETLVYTGAAIPPAIVGQLRLKAGKHFKSDIIMGYIIGASTGILVPELRKRKIERLSFMPLYSPDFKGLLLTLKL